MKKNNNPATFDVNVNSNSATASFERVVRQEHLWAQSYQMVLQVVGDAEENGFSLFSVFHFNTVDFVSSNEDRPDRSIAIKLYPNPASEQLFLDADITFPVAYNIVNRAGQLCKSGVVRNKGNAIGVHQLTEGWYNLQVTSANGNRINTPFLLK